MFFSENDITELNSSMSNMQNSNTEAKESEEDYEWEVIYEDNCDKWDCAFKICFERKKKEVAKHICKFCQFILSFLIIPFLLFLINKRLI